MASTVLKTVQILGGPDEKPYIEGHRITVQHVAEYHEHFGWSVARIAEGFGLTLAEIHAALSYYYDHKEEIDEAIRQDEVKWERIREKYPSIQDVLDGKLKLIMTPREISEEFGVTVEAVYQAVRRGTLRHRKSGGTILILRADAQARWGKHKGG